MQTAITNVVFLASYARSTSQSTPASSWAETTVSAQPKPASSRRSRRASTSKLEDVNDDEIVERLALGDLDAAEALRARYMGRLRRAATPILGDEGEVAGVVEAALEEACSGWPPERGQVGPWLTRLVRRAAVARRRALWGLDGSRVPENRRLRTQHLRKSRH